VHNLPFLVALTERVTRGEMSAEEAEQEARERQIPLTIEPDSVAACAAFEEAHWPLALALCWIMHRSRADAVRSWIRLRNWGMSPMDHVTWSARCELRASLLAGNLIAFGLDQALCGERVAISPLTWRDLSWRPRSPASLWSERSLAYADVVVEAAAVVRIWPIEERAGRPAQSIAAETDCRTELIRLMRELPHQPQPKATLRDRFPYVSDRGFHRAWADAVNTTGACAWSAPGRRRKSPQT
jgi:hypothetical protein